MSLKRRNEIISIMAELGCPKNTAELMVFFAMQEGYVTSRDMEEGTCLPQPTVSISLKVLRENDLLDERIEDNPTGKGRSVKHYRMLVNLMEAFNRIVAPGEQLDKLQELVEKEFATL